MSNSSGNTLKLIGTALAVALAFSAALVGCKDEDDGMAQVDDDGDEGATETNVAPAPCDDDSECPEGIACKDGFCDVNEMEVADAGSDSAADTSSTAPAPCEDSSDCPDGIKCVFLDGDDGAGFCDVEEMGVTPSSPAPAPCTTDADCGPDIKCKSFDDAGGPGFCDVTEMIAP